MALTDLQRMNMMGGGGGGAPGIVGGMRTGLAALQPIPRFTVTSNLHGPMGSFASLQEARAFATQHGIPLGPASNPSQTGYFVQRTMEMPMRVAE